MAIDFKRFIPHILLRNKKGAKTYIFYFVIILLMLVLSEVFFLVYSKRLAGTEQKVDVSKIARSPLKVDGAGLMEKRGYWKEYMNAVGAEQAYKDFKTIYESAPFGIQHIMSHLVGELLFEKVGIDGLSVCDSAFSFGCYHGFFGAAVEKNGLEILTDLDKACIKAYGLKGLGCPHGIGHGVLSFLGEEQLINALDLCSELSWKEPIGGCTSGVFMEYNFRTMQKPDSISTRPLDESDIHAPCSKLPKKYLQACYYEQANWWEKVFNYDYRLIGELCYDIKDQLSSEACFRGLGQSIGPSSKYNVGESKKRCSLMPNNIRELLCRQGVAWSFFAEPSQSNKAIQLCNDLDDSVKTICVEGIDMSKEK